MKFQIQFFVKCFVVAALCSLSISAKAKNHPYLFYTEDWISQLKLKIKADTTTANAWQALLQRSSEAVATGKGGDMDDLSLVYCMTKDSKYALQAKKLLEVLLAKDKWDLLEDRTPVWRSALGTAHQNGLAANTFDAIYNVLTPGERKQMAQRIVALGIEPSMSEWISPGTRMHTLNTMGHNWWSSIVYKAGLASLAVMQEIPEAKKWAEDVMQASDEWFAFSGSVLENKVANFDPSGGFYEGIGYANFGLGEYLFFRLAWTNVYGKINKPYDSLLQRSMDWFIQMSYPTTGKLLTVNFGDSSPNSNGERPVKLMIALGFKSANYEWYLHKTKRSEIREDLNHTTAFGLLLSPAASKAPDKPLYPTASIFSNMGWASMRSSWDENASMLAIKSGYTWNHAHADAGSFILYHHGKNLLIDGGTVNYGNPLYSGYAVRSEAHNVILFNGKAQEPQDEYNAVKNPGHLYHLMDAGDFKYILADATGPTAHYFLRNYRNVVWVGNVILLIDDIKTYEAGKLEFLLHTSTDVKKKGIDLEVTDSNAAVLVRPLFPETLPNGYPHDFPEKMLLNERQGIKDHEPSVKQTYYSISPAAETRQTKFITALILLDDKNKPVDGAAISGMASVREMRTGLPKIEKLESLDYNGVRITQGDSTTEIYFNLLADGRIMHRNSQININGWETDAYIFGISYKSSDGADHAKNIGRWFMANGSYIRKDDKVIFSALSKVFLIADLHSRLPAILLQGQPLINATLSLEKRSDSLQFNGNTEKAIYENAGLPNIIRLHYSGLQEGQ